MPSPDASSAGESKPQPQSQSQSLRDRLSHVLWPVKPPPPLNPALLKHAEQRADDVQNRAADHITAFSGSMLFVYIHIIWFASWIGFGVEKYPFGLLTMIVSLEAIFLSTFVMISQNRADAKRQVIADQQWKTVQEEDRQNKELLDLSRQILELTKQVHSRAGISQPEPHQEDEQPSQPGMASTPRRSRPPPPPAP
jgi:uncharacterized membrane protein